MKGGELCSYILQKWKALVMITYILMGKQEIPMDKEFIMKISDRHFGIGSDGMIVILPSDKYDFKMRMFNLDGSEAMMCGNGIRCFAKFIYDHQLSDKRVLKVETKSGLRVVELLFKG